MKDALPAILAVLSGLTALVGAYVGYATYRAKKITDSNTQRVSEVEVSLTALAAALARSDHEREQLETDRDDLRAQVTDLNGQVGALRAELVAQQREHARQITLLVEQVRTLGATPVVGGGR
jgi:septal ring factor EnvC (AmiA/AmiB activator)